MESLRGFLSAVRSAQLGENPIKPNQIQEKALEALEFYSTDPKLSRRGS